MVCRCMLFLYPAMENVQKNATFYQNVLKNVLYHVRAILFPFITIALHELGTRTLLGLF